MPVLPRYYAKGQPRGWDDDPQESEGDSKAFYVKKKFCDGRTHARTPHGQSDVIVEIVMQICL